MHLRPFPIASLALALSTAALSQTSIPQQQYLQSNLVADSTATAAATTIDPNLSGGWGISESSTGPWWVSDNNNGLSTLYNGVGAIQGLVVKIPPADPTKTPTGSPTGIVFNATAGFVLPDGKPASFLFATLDGLIVGWNGSVPGGIAQIAVNQTGVSSFDGLAVAPATVNGVTSTYLYAADFEQAVVDVYDANFHHVSALESKINSIPKPPGFAPFNIQNIGGNLYVTLALQDSTKVNQVTGPGLGLVASVTPEGALIGIAQTGSFLNSPWGVAVAPGNFGQYSHDLLVGNNGDGTISVFNPVTGTFIDQLRDSTGQPISINGLWGLSVGNGTTSGGSATSVFFAAAPGNGGLFGTLTPIQNTNGSNN